MSRYESTDCPVALVVEGDDAARNLVSAVLEETDLDVIACTSAEDALRVLERSDVNVALLFADVGLRGGTDGYALARTVEKRWPKVRMVVTSSGAGGRSVSLPSRAVFMQKPWRAFDILVEADRATIAAKVA